MSSLVTSIPAVRASTVAVLRIHAVVPNTADEGATPSDQFNCSFGSGFCVLRDRFLLTAHHVLNGGGPRDPADRFYALTVPDNDTPAYHFPITGFALERPEFDLAVLEVGPCSASGVHLPHIPVSFEPFPDGTPVVTVGYPSPEIASISVDSELNYLGGQFFLKSHANEGIVAAQYDLGGSRMYELNVGWHHGESGGPVVSTTGPPCAFSMMQHYRNVQSQHGIVAGPHRGFALSCIASELTALGVTIA